MQKNAASSGRLTAIAVPEVHAPGRLVISDSAVELLKWIALVLMTLDHINKYLLGASVPALFAAGRLAMPLFGFVLGYNLARPSSLQSGSYARTAKRLLLCGLLATGPFVLLGGLAWGWWPLNIMFTLLAATLTMYLIDRGGIALRLFALLLFLVAGAFVEFSWPGVAVPVAAWLYTRRPTAYNLALCVLPTAALALNGYILARLPLHTGLPALLAIPLVVLANRLEIGGIPRSPRLLFYLYYPGHLLFLWLIAAAAAFRHS